MAETLFPTTELLDLTLIEPVLPDFMNPNLDTQPIVEVWSTVKHLDGNPYCLVFVGEGEDRTVHKRVKFPGEGHIDYLLDKEQVQTEVDIFIALRQIAMHNQMRDFETEVADYLGELASRPVREFEPRDMPVDFEVARSTTLRPGTYKLSGADTMTVENIDPNFKAAIEEWTILYDISKQAKSSVVLPGETLIDFVNRQMQESGVNKQALLKAVAGVALVASIGAARVNTVDQSSEMVLHNPIVKTMTVPTVQPTTNQPSIEAKTTIPSKTNPEQSVVKKSIEVATSTEVEMINTAIEKIDFSEKTVTLDELVAAVQSWYEGYQQNDPDLDPQMPKGYVKMPDVVNAPGLNSKFVWAEKTDTTERYASAHTIAVALACAKQYQDLLATPGYAKYKGSMLRYRDFTSWAHAGHSNGNKFDISSSMLGTVTTVADGPVGDFKFSKNHDPGFTADIVEGLTKLRFENEKLVDSVTYSGLSVGKKINLGRVKRFVLGARIGHQNPDHHDHIHVKLKDRYKLKTWITKARWSLDKDLRIGSELAPLNQQEYDPAHGTFDQWRLDNPEFGSPIPEGYQSVIRSKIGATEIASPKQTLELGPVDQKSTKLLGMFVDKLNMVAQSQQFVEKVDNPGPGNRVWEESLSSEQVADLAKVSDEDYSRIALGGQKFELTINYYGEYKTVVLNTAEVRAEHYKSVLLEGLSLDDFSKKLYNKKSTELMSVVPMLFGNLEFAPGTKALADATTKIESLKTNPDLIKTYKQAAKDFGLSDWRILAALDYRESNQISGLTSIIEGRPLSDKHLHGIVVADKYQDINVAINGYTNASGRVVFDGLAEMASDVYGIDISKALSSSDIVRLGAVWNQYNNYKAKELLMPYVANNIGRGLYDMSWLKHDLQKGVGGESDGDRLGLLGVWILLHQTIPTQY
jgi:hypothetical protein